MSKRVMIVVNVPTEDADELRQAIGDAGGGVWGEYSYCSFSVTGTGRFVPGDNAKPAIGQVGKPEFVTEERIEVSCEEKDAKAVVDAIRRAHSYEEPAIAVYAMLDL